MKKICNICSNRLLSYKSYIKCSLCEQYSHGRCNSLSKTDSEIILTNSSLCADWICHACKVEVFPNISDNIEITTTNTHIVDNPCTSNIISMCYSCTLPLGKRFSFCEYCSNNVHLRCNLSHFGCKKCRSDMFPPCTNLFDSHENSSLFNPFDSDISDQLDQVHDPYDESNYTSILSKTLKKCKYEYLDNFGLPKRDELSVLSLNIRSLNSNFHKIRDEQNNLNAFDIICLCETNIDPDAIMDPGFYNLEGFHPPILQRPTRDSGKGGGLAIYIKNDKFESASICVVNSLCEAISTERGEFLFVEIDTGPKSKNIIVGNFYRSPAHTPTVFIQCFNDILESLKKHSNKHILLMGDANIDYIKYDICPHAKEIFDVVSQHGLIPVISRPTRIIDHSMTLIDHIYSNSITNFKASGIILNPFADHLGVYIKLNIMPQKLRPCETYTYTDFSERNMKKFENLISNTDWSTVIETHNAESKYDFFLNLYKKCYDEAFPHQTNTQNNRKRTGKPWIPSWLQDACERKNQLYGFFVKNPTTDNKDKYLKYKKWVEKMVYIAKRKYYNGLIAKHSSDAKKQWKVINNIINRNKSKSRITKLKLDDNREITNNKEIAEVFNEYFCSIAEKLKATIDNPLIPAHLATSNSSATENCIILEPCSGNEIFDIIKGLKNSTTSDFNVTALKYINEHIHDVFLDVINASLTQGIFPTMLKCAKVIPVFKSGKKSLVSNYRPISLLSVFSKVYEKVMYARVLNFLETNNSIYRGQYGFRPKHSCENALIDAQTNIIHALNRKQIALLLLIDFSKAFDMVDHDILLDKLYHLGIRGVANEWFKSYLANRSQYVCINSCTSVVRNLNYGVPQGSILGPLLFVIYINDIPGICKDVHFILYADDANIIITGHTMDEIEIKLKNFIRKLNIWVNSNSLKLNIGKTKYMIFSNLSKRDINFEINGTKIERKREERFLGVIIDEKLAWTAHKLALTRKLSANCGVLFRARHILNKDTLKTLYYSFIQSHLIYCCNVWGLGTKIQ